MDKKIISKRDSTNAKKCYHLKNNVFLSLYTKKHKSRTYRNSEDQFTNTQLYTKNYISKFREKKIIEIWSGEQRLLVKIFKKILRVSPH